MNERKLWTIMVYMEGDNNLAEEMTGALQQIHAEGVASEIRLVVLFDAGGPLQLFDSADVSKTVVSKNNDRPKPANRRRLVLRDTEFKIDFIRENRKFRVKLRRLPAILKEFVRQTISNCEADNYMLVLSGHGSGAVGDFLGSNRRRSNLSILEIESVIRSVFEDRHQLRDDVIKNCPRQKIDILGLDACLMSMVEIGYELRNHVRYLVGSEGFEPGTGWPYARILASLSNPAAYANMKHPNEVARMAAQSIVRTYIDYYFDYRFADLSADQSALDLSRSEALKDKLGALANVLRRRLSENEIKDAILLAHWEAQGYKFEQYADVWDFCDRLSIRCRKIAPEISKTCNEIKDVIEVSGKSKKRKKTDLVVHSCYSGAAFQHSHGVSVFFPWANVVDAEGVTELQSYAQLSFSRDSGWKDFLADYLLRTQRAVRFGNARSKADTEVQTSRLNRRRALFQVRFDPEVDPRFDPEVDPRFDPEVDPRFDPEVDPRFGKMPSVASMKNPPVQWRPCPDDLKV